MYLRGGGARTQQLAKQINHKPQHLPFVKHQLRLCDDKMLVGIIKSRYHECLAQRE